MKKFSAVLIAFFLILQLFGVTAAAYPAPSYGAQNALEKFENNTPMSFSHRAAWRLAPENSLLAVYESITLGIDAVEIDLMLSSDGVLVLHHDATVDRCVSGYSGNVADFTWTQLKSMPLRAEDGGSSMGIYKMTAAQAKILNALPNYSSHYGKAVSGGTISISRLDDVLDLVTLYGPNTMLTLDKCTSESVFTATYILLREKGLLANALLKFNEDAATVETWFAAAADAWNAAYPNSTITADTIRSSVMLCYSTRGTGTSVLKNHLNNGSYLKAVELNYDETEKDTIEATVTASYAAFCKKRGLSLYCNTIDATYCGGRPDNEITWATLLNMGFNGILTNRASELAAFLYDYNRQRSSNETLQAEHFHSFSTSSYQFSISETADDNMNKTVDGMYNGDYLLFRDVNFDGAEYEIQSYVRGLLSGAKLNFYVDSISAANWIASLSLSSSSACQTLSAELSKSVTEGNHDLYVQASGNADTALLTLDHFSFLRDAKYLYFGFDNTEDDVSRYDNRIYGYCNFDDASNVLWNETKGSAIAVSNSAGTMTVTPANSKIYITTIDKAPLYFDISDSDVYQIRMKLVGFTAASCRVGLDLFSDGTKIDTSNVSLSTEQVTSGEYFTVTAALTDEERAYGIIEKVQLYIGGIPTASANSVVIDYIYVGSYDDIPTPVYTATFKNGSTVLETHLVGKGESVAYLGSQPTKDADATYHYTFNGWDHTLTGITANTTFTAQFTASAHSKVTDAAVAATCTTDGKTEGSHCSVCSTVIVAQISIPATGHNYGYSNNGEDHTVTCANCSDSYAEEHSYVDGVCVCGAVEVVEPTVDANITINHTLNLASDISIIYAVKTSLLTDYDSYYLECVLPTYEGNTLVGTTTVTVEPALTGSYYYFTLTGVTAVQMNDIIEATLYMTKEGAEYVSNVDTYSVATYAYSQLNKAAASDKLKSLCADLLRYGSAAQTYKGYRTDALVNAEVTEEHFAYLSDIDAVTFGNNNTTLSDITNPSITWTGKVLNLDSKVTLKFVMNTTNYTGNLEDLRLHVRYSDYTGTAQTAVITELEEYNTANNWYSFSFDGLLAAELRQVVSVAVYEGETQVSPTLQYSADTYGNNKTGPLLDLCKALFAYSDTALAYFS